MKERYMNHHLVLFLPAQPSSPAAAAATAVASLPLDICWLEMSCNGCRVLRKGCSDTCVLRTCLQWIDTPEAQGHATVFVAKFFGRAGLMNFVSSVPHAERPAVFQSLLFEACGRTINPVTGAVGLLWEGRWDECQEAVHTVLRGGTLRPQTKSADAASEGERTTHHRRSRLTRRRKEVESAGIDRPAGLSAVSRLRQPEAPSEGSVTTSDDSGGETAAPAIPPALLNLFI